MDEPVASSPHSRSLESVPDSTARWKSILDALSMTDLEPDYFAAAGDDLDEVDDGQRKSAHGQSTDGPSTAILTGRVKDIPSQRKTLTWADESQIEEVLKAFKANTLRVALDSRAGLAKQDDGHKVAIEAEAERHRKEKNMKKKEKAKAKNKQRKEADVEKKS